MQFPGSIKFKENFGHKFRFGILMMLVIFFGVLIDINFSMIKETKEYIFAAVENVPSKTVALILGARVYSDERMSSILFDRVQTGLELYKSGRVKKLLLSGDHGTKNYDEVNTMKEYLLDKGVPAEDIFLDHAGFDTYDSFYRAKEIFGVYDVTVVTQAFHLPRAVYIGRALGMEVIGVVADKQKYLSEFTNNAREILARVKAFGVVHLNLRPKFLGQKIPITGDSKLSWD